MKLDDATNSDNAQVVRIQKKERNVSGSSSYVENDNKIIDLLNPLKSINLNTGFHSFNNFKDLKNQLETLIKTQSNIIFYVLHQNFMCDDEHKEFFKNMVGRFYNMPEWSWKYYSGLVYRDYDSKTTILKLILTENYLLSKKYYKAEETFDGFKFETVENSSKSFDKINFNSLAIEEYWGENCNRVNSYYFAPFNKTKITDRDLSDERAWEAISFDNDFEFGRYQSKKFKVKMKFEDLENNLWFNATFDWIENSKDIEDDFESSISSYGIYASIGLDNFEKIIDSFKIKAKKIDIEWNDEWLPKFDENEKNMIRSLSQTFPWTKEYIFENEKILDLDVLGLNMTVPWDMELVKFFIERGYGGRMSENKAVYDKVFEQLLTDDILKKLFNCEYTPYE